MRLNYYQNMWVMAVFINTPLLLRIANHLVFVKQGIPLPPNQSTYFGLFVFLQLVYDWCGGMLGTPLFVRAVHRACCRRTARWDHQRRILTHAAAASLDFDDRYCYIRLYKSFGSYSRKIREIDSKKAGKKAQ